MKEIKDIFENYEQKPSDEVWNRLSARLDAEMSVAPKVVNRGLSSAWKWAAAVAVVVVLGGAVAFGLLHNRSSKQQQFVENKEERTEEQVMTEEPTTEMEVVTDVLAEEPVAPAVSHTEVNASKENPAPQERPARSETDAPKTNVRQEVLPANSTLARQLAADPVLKNLSDGSVDWSMPTHLSIPNLFTPNGDKVNDLFVVEGLEQYSSPKLVVRDKNNRIVYQAENYQNSWGGENCPDGVYHYEFTFFYNGIENQATGKVRIIRS